MSQPTIEIRTTDYHTAGEPFRIVTAGAPEIPGETVLARRDYSLGSAEVDFIRRLLCHEPRGHADMYGCFPVPPNDDGANLGVLFWHKDGYSTACGHGTIALATWAVETGRVGSPTGGDVDVVIDVPSGRVTARVARRRGVIVHTTFRNVASYVIARNVRTKTSSGEIGVDVSYAGAMYASLPASTVGLSVNRDHYGRLIATGREIRDALNATDVAQHPNDRRLSGVYGTIIYDDLGDPAEGPHQRNITIFANGEVDRSPCGSGSGAQAALLAEQRRLARHQVFTNESIIGTRFAVRIAARATVDGRPAIVPEVEGHAYRTGEHTFVLDESDPIGAGFVLR